MINTTSKDTPYWFSYRACFNKCSGNAKHGDEENACSVVVIFVDRPKDQTCYLEHVKRVKCLQRSAFASDDCEYVTNFIYKKLGDGFLLYVNQVLPKDKLSHLFFVSVNSSTN
jgi:hypothetical protein